MYRSLLFEKGDFKLNGRTPYEYSQSKISITSNTYKY